MYFSLLTSLHIAYTLLYYPWPAGSEQSVSPADRLGESNMQKQSIYEISNVVTPLLLSSLL